MLVGNQQRRQSAPRQTRVEGGILPCPIPCFASAQTFKTPQKSVKKRMDRGEIDNEVSERTKNCPGFIAERKRKVDGENKWKLAYAKCIICNTQTKWYCLVCRHSFCMDNKTTKKRKKQYYSTTEKEKENSSTQKKIIYGKSCYHRHHEAHHIANHGVAMSDIFNVDED